MKSLILHPFEVRGLLDGRISQIRRPFKYQPDKFAHFEEFDPNDGFVTVWWDYIRGPEQTDVEQKYEKIPCPLGKVGDTVVCKETWKFGSRWSNDLEQGAVISYCENTAVCVHLPYEEYASIRQSDGPKYRKWVDTPSIPSVHMPAWASRITLKLNAISVERLQEMSEEDAKASGVLVQQRAVYPGEEKRACVICGQHRNLHIGSPKCCPQGMGTIYTNSTHKGGFRWIWESLYAKRGHGWDSNPWIWVWEVERV